ncbi:hypothetical protein B0T17DRAFT_39101 [Bombardia bombarda]|uniref:C2H2-type domain-containing protein n=1 Tax=Bombardia bombarda TaxID=252184 RepID=A0AA40CEI8_9PEZI|nr:hypothetical protein B0T17DRAFT_39101 [Bombardia bombarda]
MGVICPECDLEVPDRARLLAHWKDKYGKRNQHYHCSLCGILFQTEQASHRHKREQHAVEQELPCPGCKETFVSAGGLMQHIEKNLCKVIGNKDLSEHRDKMMAFARELQRRHHGLDPDAQSTRPGTANTTTPDFSEYLSRDGMVSSMGGAKLSSYWPTAENTVRPNPVTFEMKEVDFPDIAKLSITKEPSRNGEQSGPGNIKGGPQPGKVGPKPGNPWTTNKVPSPNAPQPDNEEPKPANPWAAKKNLFPNAPPPTRATPEQLQAIREPARTKETAWPEDHPNNPNFDIGKYYVQYLQKYKCPQNRCPKSFPSGAGLVAHLRSDAHNTSVKVQCPHCKKWFNDMSGLMQHAESQGVRCKIQTTTEYRPFLSQLTAGVIDTVDSPNGSGPVVYTVPEDARNILGGGDKSKEVERQVKKEDRFW